MDVWSAVDERAVEIENYQGGLQGSALLKQAYVVPSARF